MGKSEFADEIKNKYDTLLYIDLRFDNKVLYKNQSYSRKITITKILETDYIIFNITRKYYDIFKRKNDRNYDFIDYEKELKIGNKILKLDSIVIHENMHYTCYFRCFSDWFFYNDISEIHIKRIGSFDDLNKKNDTHRLATLYFYSIM
jgi:hypothetical protein